MKTEICDEYEAAREQWAERMDACARGDHPPGPLTPILPSAYETEHLINTFGMTSAEVDKLRSLTRKIQGPDRVRLYLGADYLRTLNKMEVAVRAVESAYYQRKETT